MPIVFMLVVSLVLVLFIDGLIVKVSDTQENDFDARNRSNEEE